jgi:hypothetical protein
MLLPCHWSVDLLLYYIYILRYICLFLLTFEILCPILAIPRAGLLAIFLLWCIDIGYKYYVVTVRGFDINDCKRTRR